MQIFSSWAQIPEGFGPSAVTIGKFDGVHAGHRAVIATLRALAAERGLISAILTFDRNPLSLLRPEVCPVSLVSNAQKLQLLEAAGVDATLMVPFDVEFSQRTPEDFVRSVLVESLNGRVILVGADFRFGVRGQGTVAVLQELAAEYGIEVVIMADVAPDGERRVSSTWVRELLTEGRVAEAAALLGGLPTIRSVVVHGAQRGRTLGYPTANLSPDIEGFIPADGVYAAWLTARGVRYPAAVSIGNNPTFEGIPEKQVEAHAIDQVGLELYDEVVEVSFVQFIRGMRKFSGPEALAEQMGADELAIRGVLGVPAQP